LEEWIVVLLQLVDRATREFHPAEAAERIDAEDAAAADRARRRCGVPADQRRERRVVEHPFELAVEELRLRVALHGVLEATSQIDIAERQRSILRDRRGKQVDLLVPEHVAEA